MDRKQELMLQMMSPEERAKFMVNGTKRVGEIVTQIGGGNLSPDQKLVLNEEYDFLLEARNKIMNGEV